MSAALPAIAICGSGLPGAPAFSVAVRTDRGTLAMAPRAGERGDLAALAAAALAHAGITARDLRAVRVDRGPGSYIGLRVAVTFARCLAAFAGAELTTVDSLAVSAAAALEGLGQGERTVCPALDGRQGRIQVGAYRRRGPMLVVVRPAQLLADADLAGWFAPGECLLADPALAERLRPRCDAATMPAPQPLPPWTAAALFDPTLPLEQVAPAALEPIYLAGSYV